MSIAARLGLAAVLLAGPAGCIEPWACTLQLEAGIALRVADEAGRPVAATVTIAEGDYVEIYGPDDGFDGLYHGADERAGTYEIEIIADGYQPVSYDGVEVEDDGCHVRTVELEVVMVATTTTPQP
ncbi:MAG: carboxypeptidase regulatory-like domain-containing protein [Kofleriaceae bacterium]|nr:carboxypeptidase regulatory-like domain-containing protein [Kofleriaceae bacterium]